jgi:hypothetical protein
MKIRNGFVSNSSSSSFIIAVPKDVHSLHDFHKLMFQEQTMFVNPFCNEHSTPCWDSYVISQIVWREVSEWDDKNKLELVDEYCQGWTDESEQAEQKAAAEFGLSGCTCGGCLRDFYDSGVDRRKIWDRASAIYRELATERVNAFVADNPDCKFYVVEYSDNDGELWSAMEHGDTFINIPHLKVSKH